MTDAAHCYMHDPDNADAAAETRRLGGLRRRREATLSGAYDFQGLTSVEQIRRLLEIAGVDALSLDNSIPRIRALVAVAQAAAKLLETGELEERITTLEGAVLGRKTTASDSPFEADGVGPADFGEEREAQR